MTEASQIPEERPRTSGAARVFTSPTGEVTPFDVERALALGRQGAVDDPALAEMRKNRRINARLASASADISFATGRPRDPMFYWKQNNLPYEFDKPDQVAKIREFCRVLYATHPIIGPAIDVFSKYPLTGMELTCKDDALVDFYTTHFFEDLNYEEFLPDEVGRAYWTEGEAWPLGSFNETLGVWEDDELMDPDDIEVIKSPFLKQPRLQMKLPVTIRKILEERKPEWEYKQLVAAYPELLRFNRADAWMPVSNTLLKQIPFRVDRKSNRGLPILLRAFRPVAQEEMLNAAQDAIASRMYTPLVLAKLGASATDLGTQNPWVPTEDDLEAFEDSLDAALAGDFRVLIHHFAVQMAPVFGRENMPNLNPDFDRLTDRILQVFGLSKTMLSGASAGETYAADAINRDLISQLLTAYQRKIKRFFRERALVVAEAQEHYDYEVRGGKRYVIMEEVLEVDPQTGEQRIVEQPKLLVPDLKIKAMTMKDEADQRQFFEALRMAGVPISMRTRLVNAPINLDEEREAVRQEQVDLAVEAQETRKQTYQALQARGLPIPDDLRKDFEPKARVVGQDAQGQSTDQAADPGAVSVPLPNVATLPIDDVALVPTAEDYAATQDPNAGKPSNEQAGAAVITLPRSKVTQEGRTRPEESDEQRASMPKPAHLVTTEDGRTVVESMVDVVTTEGEGDQARQVVSRSWGEVEVDGIAGRMMNGPRHVGMRRFANVDKNTPLDEQGLA